MERTTKHRILGILVVIGLVIIVLPLFQGGSDIPAETALIKAPPFPGQSADGSAHSDELYSSDQAMLNQPPVFKNPPTAGRKNKLRTDDTISPDSPARKPVSLSSADEEPAKTTPSPTGDKVVKLDEPAAISKQTSQHIFQNADKQPVKSNPSVRALHAAKKAKKVKRVKLAANASAKKAVHRYSISGKKAGKKLPTLHNDGLFQLKKPVWVIQLGSFKNKTNALRLVNRLRLNGYAAFIQQTPSHTRVYVGPEVKQGTAREVASRLKTNMKLQGIVVSYKPLAL